MTFHDILELDATVDNLDILLDWMDEHLCRCSFDGSPKVQLDIAAEEIYINIASYAYGKGVGKVCVILDITDDPLRVSITFEDYGSPYDPLKHEEPDIQLSMKERKVGGLGIFMVKKSMDEVRYEYLDGCNVLTIKKGW